MRRYLVLLVVLVLLLLTVPVHATMSPTRISGNTVSFSTVSGGWLTTPNVVTFNATTVRIRLTNLSTIADCYVDLRCVDSTGKSGYFTKNSATLLVPAIGRSTPNTVEIDFATRNLGFCSKVGNQYSADNSVAGSNNQIVYTLIGDTNTF